MQAFTHLTAVAMPLGIPNLDTDRILPARYLQKPRSAPFGDYLFRDLARRADGTPEPGFILNQPAYREARIVVGARNFGCGSSREHAVWALLDHGFRCVIAPSFGDIFSSNALKNGLLPVVLGESVVEALRAALEAAPGTQLMVDLEACSVRLPDGSMQEFSVEPFARRCLLDGIDELGYTLTLSETIAAFERNYAG